MIWFRSVAFVLLTSFCLTYNDNRCRDTSFGSYYTEQRTDPASISRYKNTTGHQHQLQNLTTAKWIKSSDVDRLPGNINETVIHACGDSFISKYKDARDAFPLIALSGPRASPLPPFLLHSFFNCGCVSGAIDCVELSKHGEGLAFAFTEPRLSHGAIVGITLGVVAAVMLVAVVMFLAGCLYGVYRKKISLAFLKNAQVQRMPAQAPNGGVLAGGLEGITVDKAVEYAYEELSKATHDFSLGNKIGQGGFGSVYYAELRGEKVAIKKMGMQASKEYLAELKALTHVHHLNLVRLIGYCVAGSHFLVYEYIENGNLSQHLHGSGKDPLPWSIRVQIALDSARGLEYIHEYTVPVFIHCDIKSANILIDKNFNGKVADFGLTRLTEVGSRSRLVGTFGYMAPEYAQYGDVSPKVDVYAFGVVLYELISAKKAIIRANGSVAEPKGLVALFDEVLLSQADPKDDLVKMIDPRLGDSYPLDSVHKMAQLAKACTREDPRRRPSMRSIVVALMTLALSTED